MSHSEQVSFVVWFVHYICFIQVCQVKSTTGQDLEEVVMALLSENGLKVANIWGQGYDGAANMSASYKGLQARRSTFCALPRTRFKLGVSGD